MNGNSKVVSSAKFPAEVTTQLAALQGLCGKKKNLVIVVEVHK